MKLLKIYLESLITEIKYKTLMIPLNNTSKITNNTNENHNNKFISRYIYIH